LRLKVGAPLKQVLDLFSFSQYLTFFPLETKPAPAADLNKIQQQQEPAPKKGIFKKVTAETATVKPKVDLQEELFPTLGEEAPKNVPKKKPEAVSPVKTETQPAQSSGPRKFINNAKKGAGEHFVPLDPTLTEKPVPVIEKPAVEEKKPEEKKPEESKPTEYKDIAPKGFFSRNTKTTSELEANAAAAEAQEDTKFKFGGEGPKKFTAGSKISFKREEEKSELEVRNEVFQYLNSYNRTSDFKRKEK